MHYRRKNGTNLKEVNQIGGEKYDFEEEQMINFNIITNSSENFIFIAPKSNLDFVLHIDWMVTTMQ